MALWVIGVVLSTAALACVMHFFAWFFWNPIGFANWSYRESTPGFVSAVYGLTVLAAVSYYIYVIIAHALSWIPHSSFDFGDVTAGEGVAMLGASLLGWLLIHAMTEMAKKLRNTKRECEMLRRSLVEAKRPVR